MKRYLKNLRAKIALRMIRIIDPPLHDALMTMLHDYAWCYPEEVYPEFPVLVSIERDV
ncbi:hypothetical protein [Cardiobacterium hominis]|jgi:hypothetical protein|uniref:hypothetical protein n=1 Tax=Cardiobacterium hominis TaxID=2718 RepID=UPI0028E5BEE9|nr:hypothetical protein [Cardiobacterium hominis]